jgi:hypothetical protein
LLILILLATALLFFLLGNLLERFSRNFGEVTDAVVGFVIPMLLFVTLFGYAGLLGPLFFAAAMVGLVIGYRNSANAKSGQSQGKCKTPPK